MLALIGQDILDSLGVPAQAADAEWAEACAAAANAYINALDVALDPLAEAQVELAGLMLGKNLYARTGSGLSSDLDPQGAAAVDSTISRLLRIGFYSPPVVA